MLVLAGVSFLVFVGLMDGRLERRQARISRLGFSISIPFWQQRVDHSGCGFQFREEDERTTGSNSRLPGLPDSERVVATSEAIVAMNALPGQRPYFRAVGFGKVTPHCRSGLVSSYSWAAQDLTGDFKQQVAA